MPRVIRTQPVSERTIERLVEDCLEATEAALGFRPDVYLDLPAGSRASRNVMRAITDALDVSLGRIAQRRGCSSVLVSVSWRGDTVEVCVVDDGAPSRPEALASERLDSATGVEHDVDHFDDAGICQWWSIPLDLA